jgi:hypothetical protein
LLLTIAKYYTPSGRLIQRDYSNGGFYDYYTAVVCRKEKTQTQVPQVPRVTPTPARGLWRWRYISGRIVATGEDMAFRKHA